MTIYIDDDWNACAPVRKMWRESTSCRDTKRGSEPRRGWQPVVYVLRQIERTQRVLYTLTLTFDTNAASSRATAIVNVKKKTPVIANVMTKPCYTPSCTTNTLTSRFQLRLSIVIDPTVRDV